MLLKPDTGKHGQDTHLDSSPEGAKRVGSVLGAPNKGRKIRTQKNPVSELGSLRPPPGLALRFTGAGTHLVYPKPGLESY